MNTKLKGNIAEQAVILEAVDVFISYASEIHLVEADKRQRKPKSAIYRGAWNLILEWAARRETDVQNPVKFGEAACGGNPEPSF